MKNIIGNFLKLQNDQKSEDYGLEAPIGSHHYRAYVGPPEDYDLVASMTFNLVTTLGLRQHHKVLDIGCGSLRLGRLLIPYLNAGNYVGIEPNKWLVREGIAKETGKEQIHLKKSRFYYDASLKNLPKETNFDFVIAQSIFSHCGNDLLRGWLQEVSLHLKDSGLFLATFLVGEDNQKDGWIYPDCVTYREETMKKYASEAGLNFSLMDWAHPRQSWSIYAKGDISTFWFSNEKITWNNYLKQEIFK